MFDKISLSCVSKENDHSSILSSESLEIKNLLHQWAGHVPSKYAEIQLLRHFNVSDVKVLGISDFLQFYTKIPCTSISQSLINIDTFLCGYPPSPRQFSFYDSYSHKICEIIQFFGDFEAVDEKLLYVDNVDTFTRGTFNAFCSKLNNVRSTNNSYVLISSNSAQSIFKVICSSNPEESLIEAIKTLSEIVTKAKHWDSSIYSLLSMWLMKAFK
ncbi:hypothetical protein MXB_667, partial [Myxobolus squamalis]